VSVTAIVMPRRKASDGSFRVRKTARVRVVGSAVGSTARTEAAFIEDGRIERHRHGEVVGMRQGVGELVGTAITASAISGRATVTIFWPGIHHLARLGVARG